MKREAVTWKKVKEACCKGFYVSWRDYTEKRVLRENNGGIVARTPRDAMYCIEHWG